MAETDQSLPVSVEDMWRAWNREQYNRSGGKKGAWIRARHAVKVPAWFQKKWKSDLKTSLSVKGNKGQI